MTIIIIHNNLNISSFIESFLRNAECRYSTLNSLNMFLHMALFAGPLYTN